MSQTIRRSISRLCQLPCEFKGETMILTKGICMSSPSITQEICMHSTVSLSPLCITSLWRRGGYKWRGCCQNGRGYSTLAMDQASSSSFSSSAEGPPQDVGALESNGTKTLTATELMDPISPAKIATMDDDQLPPLLSMIIEGLPPWQQSKYVHEAEKLLKQYVERYQNVISLDSYCRVGLSLASYMYPGVISLDRLVAISIQYALGFLLDDLFFDAPDAFLRDQYGIDRSACGSPQKMQEYLDHLDAVFSHQQPPSNPATLIETMMWESGRDILELSNPEWFHAYVDCLIEHHHTNVASHADLAGGHNLCIKDLESYTVMRAGNVGGKFIQLMIEFAINTYIPRIMRSDPFMQKVTTATSIHVGFANDIFSYHKESSQEEIPRNLITVLMECEGKSFAQTVHKAIGLVNKYARTILDLELEARNCGLQNHLQDIKALIAGNVYFGCMDKRYRQPDSVFPEQRDTSNSWKGLRH